jgi:hypothetical protein
LASLGINQIGQQGGGLLVLNGQQVQQQGQGAMPNISKPFIMARIEPHVHLSNTQQVSLGSQNVLRLEDVSGEDDVIIVGLNKECVATLRKARNNIVNNAHKYVIIKKSNGHKPFFCHF